MSPPPPSPTATGKVTLATLAAILRLSPATVSRALSGQAQVSKLTYTRVQQLAAELSYEPNQVAASLRRGHSQTLGVIIPNIAGGFFASVVDGVEAVASKAGYHLMICQSHDEAAQESSSMQALLRARVEGILVSVAGTTRTYDHFEPARRRGLPLVFFDRMLVGSEVHAVVHDDYLGAYRATEHLLRQGNRRIAHFNGPPHLNTWQNRWLGYEAALRDFGLPVVPELVRCGEMTMHAGHHGMQALLAQHPRPDAVFTANDLTAAGVLVALKEAGLRVPHDVAVVGFSNDAFTVLTEPPLTSIDQSCEQMGKAAAQLLLDLLNTTVPANCLQRQVIRPKLLVRASSMCERPI